MESPRFISNIVKTYPKMIRIEVYHEPLCILPHNHRIGKRRELESGELYEPDSRSIRRSQQLVRDYVICNRFELFCTFTFDPKKFPECKNPNLARLRMSRWLRNQKSYHSPDLKYIVIPERHKSGAIHFHALMSNYKGSLRDSKHRRQGKIIYNITGWRIGFTTAISIGDTEEDYLKVGSYVQKYITKDMSKDFNNHRYLASRNLLKPKKEYNSKLFNQTLPLGRKKIYDTEISSVYELDPAFYQSVKAYTDIQMKRIIQNRIKEEHKQFDNFSDGFYNQKQAMSHNNSYKTIANLSKLLNKRKE